MPRRTPQTLYDRIASRLSDIRKSHGLSQEELSKRLGKPQSYVSKVENAERRVDVVEFARIGSAMGVPSSVLWAMCFSEDAERQSESILDYWSITPGNLTKLVNANPSLRGILFGYVAEHKLTELWFSGGRIRYASKHDDHDRTRKGDHVISYRKKSFVVESKSLQSNSIREADGVWRGKVQVDASDRRMLDLPSGDRVNTTLLKYGEFDLLAVNCFAFTGEWRFQFALNSELPCSTYKRYPVHIREQLIASLVEVTWPPSGPFTDEPYSHLDKLGNRE